MGEDPFNIKDRVTRTTGDQFIVPFHITIQGGMSIITSINSSNVAEMGID